MAYGLPLERWIRYPVAELYAHDIEPCAVDREEVSNTGAADRSPRLLCLVRVQKLLDDRKIMLALTDAALRWLGRVGYDLVYGARPLKRAVQRYLQDPLAEMLLEGKLVDGSTLKVDEGDGELSMTVD